MKWLVRRMPKHSKCLRQPPHERSHQCLGFVNTPTTAPSAASQGNVLRYKMYCFPMAHCNANNWVKLRESVGNGPLRVKSAIKSAVITFGRDFFLNERNNTMLNIGRMYSLAAQFHMHMI